MRWFKYITGKLNKKMSIKLITVCSHPEHAETLIASATKYGWDLAVIKADWRGFGTKLIETYNYLKAHPEIEEFVFCDAFDVIVFGSPDEFLSKIFPDEKILVSCERGLWPPSLIPFRVIYKKHDHRFDYINSGLYYAKSKYFIELIEGFPPFNEIDDQFWFNMIYILQKVVGVIQMDNNQTVFNSHSFVDEGEYGYENGRVQILGNEPVFVHSNGKTLDEKLNQLIA